MDRTGANAADQPAVLRTHRRPAQVAWSPRRRAWALVATVGLVATVSGCSGDGSAAVSVAQAKVSAKEKSLTEAQAAAEAASATFCTQSADYIRALDRYGDVLHSTAPTVGDVKDAGADLEEPREDTAAAGEAAVAAGQEVTAAEQELADAEAALASAEAKAAGETPPQPETPTSSEPQDPPASLTRVQQAEMDFAEAQAGITDATPLRQAAEQFNSAAVALEMAWLQFYSDAGCLTDEQQQDAEDAVSDYTQALQQALQDAGYYTGEVDGVYGPDTVSAVEDLQKANGLPQTGALDKATEAALASELAAAGGAAATQATASTAALQQTLKLAGYWDGPVDGQWTSELTDALEALQADLGVPTTGTVDAATVAAFEEAIAQAQQTPTPSPTESTAKPSASAEPTATSKPTETATKPTETATKPSGSATEASATKSTATKTPSATASSGSASAATTSSGSPQSGEVSTTTPAP